jgi:hypothetical protein
MSKYVDEINEENFNKFLSALRSGDYPQGTGSLEEDGKFCCLGVACHLAASEGVLERRERNEGVVYYDHNSGTLPRKAADWLGIPDRHRVDGVDSFDVAFFKEGWAPFSLAEQGAATNTAIGWNDGKHKTFVEIADAFEKEFTKEEN